MIDSADHSRPNKLRAFVAVICLLAVAVGLYYRFNISQPASPQPVTRRPAASKPVGTHEYDLTFIQRSPLSTPEELARRMCIDPATLGPDYDLAKCPYKAYIPPSATTVPHGIIVYLGYKDSTALPTDWEPLLDKSHLIFITPVPHHGVHYSPSLPAWQMLGLAFDALANLRQHYKIDDTRLCMMTWEAGMQTTFAAADQFTGYIVTYDNSFFRTLRLPNGSYYPPTLPIPIPTLYFKAKLRPLVLIGQSCYSPNDGTNALLLTLQNEGFTKLFTQDLDLTRDIHYPNLKVDWLQNAVLPFLDKSAATTQP